MRRGTLWKHRRIIFGRSLASRTPDIALGFDCVCVSISLVEKQRVESAPHLCNPDVGNKQTTGVVTLLSSMCIDDGKGHSGYTSYSSSGVLIREDEQKTIAGSLLPESQILQCGF